MGFRDRPSVAAALCLAAAFLPLGRLARAAEPPADPADGPAAAAEPLEAPRSLTPPESPHPMTAHSLTAHSLTPHLLTPHLLNAHSLTPHSMTPLVPQAPALPFGPGEGAPGALPAWLHLGLDALVRLETARSFDLGSQSLAVGARASRALTRVRPTLSVAASQRLAITVQPQWYGATSAEQEGRFSLYQAVAAWTAPGAEIRVGRQEFAFGSTLLLGADTFFDGLAYDGARATLRRGSSIVIDAFAGRTATAQSGGFSGSVAGLWTSWGQEGHVQADAYTVLDTGGLPGEHVRTLSLGGRLVVPLGRAVTLEVEPIVQRGSYAPGPGPELDVAAHGGNAGLTIELGRLSFAAGCALGSADGDPAGGRWTEFRHPAHDIAQVGSLGLAGDLSGIGAGDARASGLHILTLGAAARVGSATLALDLHRLEAGRVTGARSSDVGLEVDAALNLPLGERAALTLAASSFRGGDFYRGATGLAPAVTYVFAGCEADF